MKQLLIAAALALLVSGCAKRSGLIIIAADPGQSGVVIIAGDSGPSAPMPTIDLRATAEAEKEIAAAQVAIQEAQERQYRLGCSDHNGYIDESALAETKRINATLGGDAFWLFGVCRVDYEDWSGWYSYPVSIDATGAWDLAQAGVSYSVCEMDWELAAESAQDGYPWAVPAIYHDDTGVCVAGDPG